MSFHTRNIGHEEGLARASMNVIEKKKSGHTMAARNRELLERRALQNSRKNRLLAAARDEFAQYGEVPHTKGPHANYWR